MTESVLPVFPSLDMQNHPPFFQSPRLHVSAPDPQLLTTTSTSRHKNAEGHPWPLLCKILGPRHPCSQPGPISRSMDPAFQLGQIHRAAAAAGPTLCSRAPRHVGVEIGLLGARGARPGAEDCLRCGRFREQIEVIHGQCCVEVLGG